MVSVTVAVTDPAFEADAAVGFGPEAPGVEEFQPVVTQDPPHRRGQHPAARRQIHRTALGAAPQPTDPLLGPRVGAPPRPRAAIHQARVAVLDPAAPPLGHRAPRQPHLAGCLGLRLPRGHPPDQQQPPAGVKHALPCDIEPPVLVGCDNTTLAQEAHPVMLLPISVSGTSRCGAVAEHGHEIVVPRLTYCNR